MGQPKTDMDAWMEHVGSDDANQSTGKKNNFILPQNWGLLGDPILVGT